MQNQEKESDRLLYEKTKMDLEELVQEKARGAAFRGKCKWYLESDHTSRYFLNLEKQRSGAKNMSALIKDSEIITDPDILLKEQQEFYAKLYKSDPNIQFKCDPTDIPKLSEADSETMEHPISLAELTEALKQSRRNVTPGIDGLTTSFFIVFRNKLGPILTVVCRYSFLKGRLFASGLKGIITTIPKKNLDSRFVKHLRPISLLCTDYKLIEKVLVNRIKLKLLNIIPHRSDRFLEK